jgi:hypothetical protein
VTVVELVRVVLAAEVDTSQPVWELFLVVCGGIGVVSGAALVVWKVVRPHVDKYVRSLLVPIGASVEAVRHEVVNGEEESLHQRATTAAASAERAEALLSRVSSQLGRIGRRVEAVDGRLMVTRSILDQHVQEARRAERAWTAALEAQGIDLPRIDRERPTEEEDG